MNGKFYYQGDDGTYQEIQEVSNITITGTDKPGTPPPPHIMDSYEASLLVDLEKVDPEVIDMIYDTNRNKLPECEVCPVQGNALACALRECQARELHNYKIMKGWHEKWIENKCCMACENSKCISDDRNAAYVCKKRKIKRTEFYKNHSGYDLLPLDMTCDKFKAVPWEKTEVYKEYEKRGMKK